MEGRAGGLFSQRVVLPDKETRRERVHPNILRMKRRDSGQFVALGRLEAPIKDKPPLSAYEASRERIPLKVIWRNGKPTCNQPAQ